MTDGFCREVIKESQESLFTNVKVTKRTTITRYRMIAIIGFSMHIYVSIDATMYIFQI